jgi:hypothetical protein
MVQDLRIRNQLGALESGSQPGPSSRRHPQLLNPKAEPRDGNSGTGTIFYPRVAPVPNPNRDGYFFPPAGNPTGTRYFTTAIILSCEQVKMCSSCYINYDLF